MQKFNFSYDKDNDDLFLFNSSSKSKGSVEIGELVIDYNSKKELVGIQIMNASKFIADIIENNGNSLKEMLSELKECKVDVKIKSNMLIVKIYLLSKFEQNPSISVPLNIPKIQESSPALAYG